MKSYEQKHTSAVLKNALKSHLLKPESRECFLYIALPLPGQWEKIKLNFYFHNSLWCLKGFMKALFFISIQLSEMHGTGRVKICFKQFFFCLWSPETTNILYIEKGSIYWKKFWDLYIANWKASDLTHFRW